MRIRLLAAFLAILASLVASPAGATPPDGCEMGTDAVSDVAAAALDLTSAGWVDTYTSAGQLWTRATLEVRSLAATPAANVPSGASSVTWEMRFDNTGQRGATAGASTTSFLQARLDAVTGVPIFTAGWVQASLQPVPTSTTFLTGHLEPGTPGRIVFDIPLNQLGLEAGDGWGDFIEDGVATSSVDLTGADRAPDTGYGSSRYWATGGSHTCVDTSTWPAPATAREADDFVDSVGVNVRLQYAPSNYNGLDTHVTQGQNYPQVRSALTGAGIRYVRDFVSTADNYPQHQAELAYLYNTYGIRTDLVLQNGVQSVTTVMDWLHTLGDAVVSVEGWNEPDLAQTSDPNFPASQQAFQQAMYAAVKGDATTSDVLVLPPSLAAQASYATLGDLSAYLDAGNLHDYAFTEPLTPEYNEQWFGLQAKVSGTKPIQMTETGWMNPAADGAPGTALSFHTVSERAGGAYVPKALLTNFAQGVDRTYITELLDQEPFIPGELGHFGIVRSDFSPKPAYTAIANLNALLNDPGASFTPGSLTYSVSGTELRHVLMQKRDGTFWLAVWRDDLLYQPDPAGKDRTGWGELTPAAASATVTLGSAKAVQVYNPSVSQTPVSSTASTTSVALTINGTDIALLRIS